MQNLRDRLRHLIDNNQLSEPFQICDITDGKTGPVWLVDREYESITIQTTLANHSIGPGDRKGQAVKDGRAIHYHKHSESATYSLFEEDVDDYESSIASTDLDQGTTSGDLDPRCNGKNEPDRIAKDFVEYLREKPFRIALNRGDRRTWYPELPVVGWQQRLDNYSWNGTGWNDTTKKTDYFVEQLERLETNNEELQIRQQAAGTLYKEIAEWGNPRATSLPDNVVLNHLVKVWAGKIDTVDSTLTKLYAFAKPNEYVIYDSRVGTAILSIAEDIYRYRSFAKDHPYYPAGSSSRIESVSLYFRPVYSNIGRYDGAGGTRPRAFRHDDWPTGYRSVDAQLEANDLCCRIVRHLNTVSEDGRNNWNLREVEAVLFMEGY